MESPENADRLAQVVHFLSRELPILAVAHEVSGATIVPETLAGKAKEARLLVSRVDDVGLVAVARDAAALTRVSEVWASGKHEALWLAMGYPRCCALAQNNLGTLLPNASGELSFPWQLNVFWPNLALLPFVPCTLRCGAAVRFANQLLPLIPEGIRSDLETVLRAPVVFRRAGGEMEVSNPWFSDTFDSVGPNVEIRLIPE
ncbi:MAG: hypothetical protein IMX00_04145 [Limnochordales bacterium]|nr:hypothetical protein [Limnochordales bacterium]